jgi:hypothetical protein
MTMYGGKKSKAIPYSKGKTTKIDDRTTKPSNRTGKTSQGNIGSGKK